MNPAVTRAMQPGFHVLAASAVAVSLAAPGHTNETILATIAVPAGAMGPNGILRVTTLWTYTNSANNKTLRGRLGGIGGVAHLGAVLTASVSVSHLLVIRNRNAQNSQISAVANSASGVGSSTGANLGGALDTALAQDFVLSAQLALGSETITLESYIVELFYKA